MAQNEAQEEQDRERRATNYGFTSWNAYADFLIKENSAHMDRKKGPDYDPEKCDCKGPMVHPHMRLSEADKVSDEHIDEDFCPGNLRSPPNSISCKFMHSHWHKGIMGLVIDEQQPSRRFNDIQLDRWWSTTRKEEVTSSPSQTGF